MNPVRPTLAVALLLNGAGITLSGFLLTQGDAVLGVVLLVVNLLALCMNLLTLSRIR